MVAMRVDTVGGIIGWTWRGREHELACGGEVRLSMLNRIIEFFPHRNHNKTTTPSR